MQLPQPHSESAVAVAERLVSKPELLWCHWGRHLLKSSCQSTALQVHQPPSLPRPIGECGGRECGTQQPSHARHQLVPACRARGACNWCRAAHAAWCSDMAATGGSAFAFAALPAFALLTTAARSSATRSNSTLAILAAVAGRWIHRWISRVLHHSRDQQKICTARAQVRTRVRSLRRRSIGHATRA